MNAPTHKPGKKMTAGKRDLTAAVAQVHSKPRGTANPDGVSQDDVRELPDHLLLAAGDELGRETFFEHDDSQDALVVRNKEVYVVLGAKVALPDYRTAENQRTHRSMITIPPKVRENIRQCFGVDDDSEFPITTAIIALADYAAMMLKRDQKCLFVDAAPDPYAEKRKAARKTVRQANAK